MSQPLAFLINENRSYQEGFFYRLKQCYSAFPAVTLAFPKNNTEDMVPEQPFHTTTLVEFFAKEPHNYKCSIVQQATAHNYFY